MYFCGVVMFFDVLHKLSPTLWETCQRKPQLTVIEELPVWIKPISYYCLCSDSWFFLHRSTFVL